MTATNVILRQGEAHLVTDGALMISGKLVGRMVKTLPMPHIGIAAAMRGTLHVAERMLFDVSKYQSMAEMRSSIESDLRKRFWWKCKILPWVYDFDLVVAGVTQEGEAFGFTISSLERLDEPPFTIVDIDFIYTAPGYDADLLQKHIRPILSKSRVFRDGVDGAAIAIINHQRGIPKDTGVGKGQLFVGGFAQITSIYSGFIETRILRTWPNEIGVHIGGLGGDGR